MTPPPPTEWARHAPGWLRDALRRLFRGEDLPAEPWAGLAAQYRAWSAAGGPPAEVPSRPFAEALGRLALVATAPLDEAAREQEALAKEGEKGLPRLLARAVLERRRRAAEGTDRAAALVGLAEALYQLVPFLDGEEEAQEACGRVAATYAESVRQYLDRGDLTGAEGPASMGSALINTRGLSAFFDLALEWGRRLALERPQGGGVSLGSLMVCNNLLTTCGSLARARPDRADHFFDLGTRYARHLLDGLERCPEADAEPSLEVMLREAGYRGLVFAQMNLLQGSPERFREIAPLVWQHVLAYELLGRRSGGPDLRARAADLKQRVHAAFLRADREWTERHAGEVEEPGAAMERLGERLDEARKRAAALAQQVLACPAAAGREALLDQALGDGYRRIGAALAVVLAEVGLNLHACRALTALGGIASGRLLPSMFLFTWLFPLNEHEVLPQAHQRSLFESQNAFARWRMKPEIDLLLALTELAVLAEGLQLRPDVGPRLRGRLRAANARLLASLATEGQLCGGHTLGPAQDLRHLFAGLSPESVRRAWQGYAGGAGEDKP